MTRVVLTSGKGGVGKTTVAAATAVRAAELGHKTLALSLDRAHNLGDVLGVALSAEPGEVPGAPGLVALEADPQAELRRHWGALEGYLARLLEWAGLGGAEADEIAVFPGLEELLVLSRLTELVEAGSYDLIVVDLAPTASSLRLLSFPEMMTGPIGKLVRWERSLLRLARPLARRALSMPVPEDDAYDALEAVAARLGRLKELLTDPERAVVRLVSIPERVVLDETRAAFTLLSLFGMCVDAVVMNRVLPDELDEGYLAEWTRIQAEQISRASEELSGVPLLKLRFQPAEVMGARALREAARELYGERDPSAAFVAEPPLRFHDDDGETVLELRLPHIDASTLDLKQRGDDLIVSAGGWRRLLQLPPSLRGRAVDDATFERGALSIRFERPNVLPTKPEVI